MVYEANHQNSAFIVLALILLVQVSSSAGAYPAPKYGAQDGISKFENEVPMSFSHQCAWRMAPSNSLQLLSMRLQ